MTNGNRHDPDRYYDRFIQAPTYTPRRRRSDKLISACVGFAVGALFGLSAVAAAVFVNFVAGLAVGAFGYWPTILGIVAVSGGVLAVSAYRNEARR